MFKAATIAFSVSLEPELFPHTHTALGIADFVWWQFRNDVAILLQLSIAITELLHCGHVIAEVVQQATFFVFRPLIVKGCSELAISAKRENAMENGIKEKSTYEEPMPASSANNAVEIEKGPWTSVNASGYSQETLQHFGPLNLIGISIVSAGTWSGLGSSLVVAIYNGGPPGVIYEFIAVTICSCFAAASIAELASAMPSSAGVYHYASVCGGKEYGRVAGWFAGWLNFFTWIFAVSSVSAVVGNEVVTMYGLFHPEFEPKSWHTFVCYVIFTWLCCLVVLFLNRALPMIQQLSLILVCGGVAATVMVCAIMPKVNRTSYASGDFVWKDWKNQTGWSSNGLIFVAGMLNGAFVGVPPNPLWCVNDTITDRYQSIGFPNLVTHLAEEIPNPNINVPKAICYQIVLGFFTAFCFLISIFYAVTDLDAVLNSPTSFPLTEVYRQATGSAGGALGLVLVVTFNSIAATIGCYVAAGRTFWTLARDNVTPFSSLFRKIDPKRKTPFNATIFCGCCTTALACIYVGSSTAFNSFVASAVITSMLSYLATIIPHLLRKRKSFEPGAFRMSGWIGWVVNIVSCLYMIAFIIIFSFPSSLPVEAANMNYTVLIVGGLSISVAAWWFVRREQYQGPKGVPREGMKLA
ncbi:choline transporter [Physcia stellaris]|nr:choline transporter [Physcia stellaris]